MQKKLALTLWLIVISISLITWNQDVQAKERTNKLTKHRVRKIAGISLIATGIGLIIALPFYQNKNKPLKISHSPWISNDYSRLNPILIQKKHTPTSTAEIQNIIRNHTGKISIAGANYSMGGQTSSENCVQIDTSKFNQIINFDRNDKEVTVQSGITWEALQKIINPFNLSIKNMQTYRNFSVGGSLSVNAHGRYWQEGPLINSVKSIKVILANGEEVAASREKNQDIFYSSIGGYGGIGLITEATLKLEDNINIERQSSTFDVDYFSDRFKNQIKNNGDIKLYNCFIYPPDFTKARDVVWTSTTKSPTTSKGLRSSGKNNLLERLSTNLLADIPCTKTFRQKVFDPLHYKKNKVATINQEACDFDVGDLPVTSRFRAPKLYEYFIPERNFDAFIPKIRALTKKYHPNIVNLSIRHVKGAPDNMLSWAKEDSFAFVFYNLDKTNPVHQKAQRQWNSDMIDAAIALEGSFYMPYEIVATKEQFKAAYPNYNAFFETKAKYDPENRFTNKLWDKYYSSK